MSPRICSNLWEYNCYYLNLSIVAVTTTMSESSSSNNLKKTSKNQINCNRKSSSNGTNGSSHSQRKAVEKSTANQIRTIVVKVDVETDRVGQNSDDDGEIPAGNACNPNGNQLVSNGSETATCNTSLEEDVSFMQIQPEIDSQKNPSSNRLFSDTSSSILYFLFPVDSAIGIPILMKSHQTVQDATNETETASFVEEQEHSNSSPTLNLSTYSNSNWFLSDDSNNENGADQLLSTSVESEPILPPSTPSSIENDIFYSANSLNSLLEAETNPEANIDDETEIQSQDELNLSLMKTSGLDMSRDSLLSVSSYYKTNQPQPSTSRNYGTITKRKQFRSESEKDDESIFKNCDYCSMIDPSKIWLYKTSSTKYPDIILNLNDEDENVSLPILSPSKLRLLRERQEQEIQVYYEEEIAESRHGRARSGGTSTPPMLRRLERGHASSLERSSVTQFTDEDSIARRESLRKHSSISRVLVVNDDNQYEDLLHAQVDAMDRRLARDNIGALHLLKLIGEELEVDSGEVTPVGFEYADSVLKRRFLISWKVALLDIKHKKSKVETVIPLAATSYYRRSISKCLRWFRIIKLYCTCCLRCLRLRQHKSEADLYENELVTAGSIEAFLQEIEVMENVHKRARMSDKRGNILGPTVSLKQLKQLLETRGRKSK